MVLIPRCAGIAALIVSANMPMDASAAAAGCDTNVLGTARTLILKREYAAYGKAQHSALPLHKGEVVLTFDDGPRPETTPRVLKALTDQCVKATFFMVGNNLAQYPDLARRVASEGHSTAMHSYTHANLGTMSPADQLADLKKTEDVYQETFGKAAPAYRFPFLEETLPLMSALKAENIAVFSVDLGIEDWQPNDTPESLATRLADRLKSAGGGIILMHDANAPTANAMPVLLKVLKDHGYSVVHLEWEK